MKHKGSAVRKGLHLTSSLSKCFLPLYLPSLDKPERLCGPADTAIPSHGSQGHEAWTPTALTPFSLDEDWSRAEPFLFIPVPTFLGSDVVSSCSPVSSRLCLCDVSIHISLAAFHTFCVLHQKVLNSFK